MTKSKLQRLVERSIEVYEQLEACKPLYKELDALTHEIAHLVSGGAREFQHRGMKVKVVDNFSEKNTVFRPAAVRRFELSFEPIAKGKS